MRERETIGKDIMDLLREREGIKSTCKTIIDWYIQSGKDQPMSDLRECSRGRVEIAIRILHQLGETTKLDHVYEKGLLKNEK